MTIQVMVRTVYGKNLVYPICDKAKAFAQIAGHKTLDQRAIALIESLGFEVEYVQYNPFEVEKE